MRTVLVALLLAAPHGAIGTVTPGTESDVVPCVDMGTWHDSNGSGDVLIVEVVTRQCTSAPGPDGGPPVITEVVRLPLPFCDEPDLITDPRPCIPDTGLENCPDGTRPLGRQFSRTIIEGVATPWQLTDPGGCPVPPDLDVQVTRAFTTATLAPAAAGRQPVDGDLLVNMPLVLYADPTPQTWTTTLIGWSVTITATPATYTWDLGGAVDPIVTTDPGAPYPDHTLAPVLRRLGTYPLTLTTTYSGTYRLGPTGPLHPIAGTAAAITELDPITVIEVRTHLVTG